MPFVASASQALTRVNILLKKLSAKDCDSGVELAVVEAVVARLRSSSFSAFARTEVMAILLIVCMLPSGFQVASCGLVDAISSAIKPQ